ncbi:MAG TPA: response regulator [Woeseiaceae bacterium]|nr:response regulator [Woeseiaceae bacterium]
MYRRQDHDYIRVLVADDDEHVLECYLDAFGDEEPTNHMKALDALAAELFDPAIDIKDEPRFDIVACSQGDDAVDVLQSALDRGQPFDVVILDMRMPPGIDGVEAGSKIRQIDPDVNIVFVSGYSDTSFEELKRRVPPPVRLHYFNKPLSFSKLAEDVVAMVKQ